MSWKIVDIEIDGTKVSAYLSNEGIYSVPFNTKIKVGDTFEVKGKTEIVDNLVNYLNRNEQLLIMGKKDGKSKARRNGNKTGSKDLEGQSND